MTTAESAECWYGDHAWRGAGACVRCGYRLRCGCGAFVREDGMDAHVAECRWVARSILSYAKEAPGE